MDRYDITSARSEATLAHLGRLVLHGGVVIIAFGRRSCPLRLCCATHFALLVAAMHPVDYLLMVTAGERVPTGVA